MSCLGLYFFPSSVECHVYFMLYSMLFLRCFIFCLSFIFSFILHPSCINFYHCSYLLFFPSFLLIHLSIHDKNGESLLESIPKCIVISIWLMFTFLRGRSSTLCTFVGGESHKGDAYIKGEKTSFFEKTLFRLILLYACFLVALWYFKFHLVSMLCCSHHIMLMC